MARVRVHPVRGGAATDALKDGRMQNAECRIANLEVIQNSALCILHSDVSATPVPGLAVSRIHPALRELVARHRCPVGVALSYVLDIPLVIGSADDGADDLRDSLDLVGEAERAGVEWWTVRLHRAGGMGLGAWGMGPRIHRFAPGFKLLSKISKIRRYSSVHESGRTKPWFSTGYDASSQLVLPSSIRRCVSRTMSW